KRITRDHSLVQEMVEAGKITVDEAFSHPNRNIITKALGVDEKVEGDFERFPLFNGDLLLLCSDGLCGFAEDSLIRKAFVDLAGEPPIQLSPLANRFIELAYACGGGDNISVALYWHQEN
ncbi:serine/threonine protein phosphatase, partial [bacterium]|nr:serine/threonine protein phosphatase [bacterium]